MANKFSAVFFWQCLSQLAAQPHQLRTPPASRRFSSECGVLLQFVVAGDPVHLNLASSQVKAASQAMSIKVMLIVVGGGWVAAGGGVCPARRGL